MERLSPALTIDKAARNINGPKPSTTLVVAQAPAAHAGDTSYPNYLLQHGYGGSVGPAWPGAPQVGAPAI